MSDPIYGELIRAGTFTVQPDGPMPGLHICCTEAELSAIKTLPIYRRVAVVPADDYDAMRAAMLGTTKERVRQLEARGRKNFNR